LIPKTSLPEPPTGVGVGVGVFVDVGVGVFVGVGVGVGVLVHPAAVAVAAMAVIVACCSGEGPQALSIKVNTKAIKGNRFMAILHFHYRAKLGKMRAIREFSRLHLIRILQRMHLAPHAPEAGCVHRRFAKKLGTAIRPST